VPCDRLRHRGVEARRRALGRLRHVRCVSDRREHRRDVVAALPPRPPPATDTQRERKPRFGTSRRLVGRAPATETTDRQEKRPPTKTTRPQTETAHSSRLGAGRGPDRAVDSIVRTRSVRGRDRTSRSWRCRGPSRCATAGRHRRRRDRSRMGALHRGESGRRHASWPPASACRSRRAGAWWGGDASLRPDRRRHIARLTFPGPRRPLDRGPALHARGSRMRPRRGHPPRTGSRMRPRRGSWLGGAGAHRPPVAVGMTYTATRLVVSTFALASLDWRGPGSSPAAADPTGGRCEWPGTAQRRDTTPSSTHTTPCERHTPRDPHRSAEHEPSTSHTAATGSTPPFHPARPGSTTTSSSVTTALRNHGTTQLDDDHSQGRRLTTRRRARCRQGRPASDRHPREGHEPFPDPHARVARKRRVMLDGCHSREARLRRWSTLRRTVVSELDSRRSCQPATRGPRAHRRAVRRAASSTGSAPARALPDRRVDPRPTADRRPPHGRGVLGVLISDRAAEPQPRRRRPALVRLPDATRT